MQQSNNRTIEPPRFESLYPAKAWFLEIEEILNFIKQGKSVELVGIPGTGRSNLLGLLSYNRPARIVHLGEEGYKKFHFVWINLSEVKRKPQTELVKFIFITLIDSLGARAMKNKKAKVEEIFASANKMNDEMVFFQGLKKAIDYLSLEKDLTIIFLFDRFEEYIPMLTSDFFTSLRSIRNRVKYKFSVVFSLTRPLEEILEPEMYSDFAEFFEGNIIYLKFGEEESLNFRIKHLEEISKKRLPKNVLDEILKLTAGHGKLTRLCIEYWFLNNNLVKGQLISDKKIENLFYEIWNSLTPSEQEFLMNGAISDTKYLESVGLLQNVKLTIPLFAEFIKEGKNELKKNENLKIVFDQEKNEIKKGDSILSDLLTRYEFKLLKLFLENEDKILEREEIITKIWGDQASVAGVTDQALDQLIFRLRKKTEENPNEPKHIQTIKGRGFKLAS